MLRASSYMNFVDIGDGTSLLYSGRTFCMDLVPQAYVKGFLKGDFSSLSKQETDYLTGRGHLTMLSRTKELADFRKQVGTIAKTKPRLAASEELTLSFVLTYKCNLACKYCYQKSLPEKVRAGRMTAELVDEILNSHAAKLFPKRRKKDTLSFILFGGEPFLPPNRDAILKILGYAGEHSIRVSCATNAVFVPQMIDCFGEEFGKIQLAQITLDGDRAYHDMQRIPRSGKPTFDAIISALHLLKKTGARVFVRIHMHPGKIAAAKNLVAFLEREKIAGGNVFLYFASLNDAVVFDPDEAWEFQKLFAYVSQKYGEPPSSNLTFLKNVIESESGGIFPRMSFCSLGNDTCRVIDPLGDVYDCYEDAGDRRRRIGSLSQGRVKYFQLRATYARRTLPNIPECMRCSLALYCGGGCAARARANTGSIFKAACQQQREYTAQTLKAYLELRRREAREGGDKWQEQRKRAA